MVTTFENAFSFTILNLLTVRKDGVDLSGDQDSFPSLARSAILTLVECNCSIREGSHWTSNTLLIRLDADMSIGDCR